MKIFHTTKCRGYLHKKLNTSTGVIRSRELVLATQEMSAALGKQAVTNIKRITISKGEEKIETNTYILTFNQPHIPKEVKIGYCVERVKQYVPAPLRYFKCQKYGHHREACRGQQTCTKCSDKDQDHMVEDCLKETRCVNCQQNHLAYARSCKAYEKEILEVKHKRNVSFLEARKIVGTYMGEKSYAISYTINQDNRYRALMEKLIQLEPNYWLKFKEQLKNQHSAELQTQLKLMRANKGKTNETTKVKSPNNPNCSNTNYSHKEKITCKSQLSQITNPTTFI